MSISIDEFRKAEIRVGRIVSVDDIPAARNPMYRLAVNFGDTTKQCVAGIKRFYTREELVDKTVVAVINLQPKNVAGVVSECMLLAAYNDTALSLLSPDKELPPGTGVS